MNSTLADHKVEDLLEKISGMDMYNLQEVNSELDEILTPFSLLPPLDYDNDDKEGHETRSTFPSAIDLPDGVKIAERWLSRVTLMGNITLSKLSPALTNDDLITWGIIQRGNKLAFQFLIKRRTPIKKKPSPFQQFKASTTETMTTTASSFVGGGSGSHENGGIVTANNFLDKTSTQNVVLGVKKETRQ